MASERAASALARALPRLALLGLLAGAIALFFALGLSDVLTFEALKAEAARFEALRAARPGLVALVFFLLYVALTGLSLPGAALMTLAAGALFGLVTGTVLVSFASTIGATCAFLAARFLFREAVRRRLGGRLAAVEAGMARDGALYLFTLRLVPIVPFFLVNLVMGLTPVRTRTFALVSQAGMLPGTIVYVNAGTELAAIESAGDILSPRLLVAFLLLGLFPWAARWVAGRLRAARA